MRLRTSLPSSNLQSRLHDYTLLRPMKTRVYSIIYFSIWLKSNSNHTSRLYYNALLFPLQIENQVYVIIRFSIQYKLNSRLRDAHFLIEFLFNSKTRYCTITHLSIQINSSSTQNPRLADYVLRGLTKNIYYSLFGLVPVQIETCDFTITHFSVELKFKTRNFTITHYSILF